MYWNLKELMRKIICQKGLTLTWDVLKLIFSCRHIKHPLGLTLTWDVLKFNKAGYNSITKQRLTLTWDVLKCTTINIDV